MKSTPLISNLVVMDHGHAMLQAHESEHLEAAGKQHASGNIYVLDSLWPRLIIHQTTYLFQGRALPKAPLFVRYS